MWILFLLLLLSISQLVHADVYVVTDPSNHVYSLSEADDAVIPAGYTKTVLKRQRISELPITGSSSLYTFNNGTFTPNAQAILAQQNAEAQAMSTRQAKQATRASALAKLTDAMSKVSTSDALTNSEIDALLSS